MFNHFFKRTLQDDADEDDSDSIERVLWHQPKGAAEAAIRNNKSALPSVLSTMSDSELEWDNVEFYVKWKGQSYLHCQWKSFSDLQNVSLKPSCCQLFLQTTCR